MPSRAPDMEKYCENHPKSHAVGSCEACHKMLCLMCLVERRGMTFCSDECAALYCGGSFPAKAAPGPAPMAPSPDAGSPAPDVPPPPAAKPAPPRRKACFWHPEVPYTALCDRCGTAVCGACMIRSPRGTFCTTACQSVSESIHRQTAGPSKTRVTFVWTALSLAALAVGVGTAFLMLGQLRDGGTQAPAPVTAGDNRAPAIEVPIPKPPEVEPPKPEPPKPEPPKVESPKPEPPKPEPPKVEPPKPEPPKPEPPKVEPPKPEPPKPEPTKVEPPKPEPPKPEPPKVEPPKPEPPKPEPPKVEPPKPEPPKPEPPIPEPAKVQPPPVDKVEKALNDAARLLREATPLYKEVAEADKAPPPRREDLEAVVARGETALKKLVSARTLYEGIKGEAKDPNVIEQRIKRIDRLAVSVSKAVANLRKGLD